MKNDTILLGHGSGGRMSHELISNVFAPYFYASEESRLTDSAVLEMPGKYLAFTTDSYVVQPVFFSGGNIGKLAVCGTVNDLAVSGAQPLYMSVSFIIEEGLPIAELQEVVQTMAAEAKKAGVRIVTGDTKVVDKGKCDKLFINTSGVGVLNEKHRHISFGHTITEGDAIIINGDLADHGMAIMAAREGLEFETPVLTDSAPLNGMIHEVLEATEGLRFMRDITRGGLTTVLVEMAQQNNIGIEIDETELPVKEQVRGLCEMLGFDPLLVANEGKLLMVVAAEEAAKVLKIMQQHQYGHHAAIIGKVVPGHKGKALLNTAIGGRRMLDMLAGEQLPRIC